MQAGVSAPLITWLGEGPAPDGVLDTLLGGKGASLDRLIRMGAPTPPGFCLTTAAFRRQLALCADDVAAAISGLPAEESRARLTELVLTEPWPPDLVAAVEHALHELGGHSGNEQRFAVRSSAVGEDGATASFAGIHETELELTADAVADAVRRCWASLWSRRAVEYRASHQLPMEGEMAVVVQQLVPADAAAVVFTRHPVTRRDDQLLINAVAGLGEALVSGTAIPDEIVIDKATLEVAHLVPADGKPVLGKDQLHALAILATQLEATFGGPIDIEAAMAGESWHVLQARPITA
jgi:pyruvate,water dikinase